VGNVIRLVMDLGELVKVALKRGGGKMVGGGGELWVYWVFWHLCVLGYISVVVDDVCVRIVGGWHFVQLVQQASQ
jgi:hypothetical protein